MFFFFLLNLQHYYSKIVAVLDVIGAGNWNT